MTKYQISNVCWYILILLSPLITDQYVEVSIDGSLVIFERNDSLDIRVSTVDVLVKCNIDNFSQWDKDLTLYSNDKTIHFQFFSLLDGGLYICQADKISISLELIPIGIGMILFSKIFDSFQMLSNNSLVIGPFHDDALLSCVGSSPVSFNFSILWYSSNTNYAVPLPMDPITNQPFIPPIGSHVSANGTLLSIQLGIFFQSPDNEAIYQCIALDNTFRIQELFIQVYSRPPIYFHILIDELKYVIRRDLLFGNVPIYTVPLHSTLNFECLVENPEVLFSDGKSIDNLVIDEFVYNNIGRYECRKKSFDTVSVRVDILLPANIVVYFGNATSKPICSAIVQNCTLPVGSWNVYLHCNTSSSQFYWEQPTQEFNDDIFIPKISSLSSGKFICHDSHYSLQDSVKLILLTSGISIDLSVGNFSTTFALDNTVIISSYPFSLTCYVGSIEDFWNYNFFYSVRRSINFIMHKNISSHSITLYFTEFSASNNGNYMCGARDALHPNITLTLYYIRSVPTSFPKNLRVNDVGPFYISLKWDDLPAIERGAFLTHFHVSYRVKNSTFMSTIYGIKGFSFVLTSLCSSTLYAISVSAANTFGVGPSTPSLLIYSSETDAFSLNFTSHSFSHTSAYFGWNISPFSDVIVEYFSVHLSGQKDYSYVFTIPEMSYDLSFNTSHHFLQILIPQTIYRVDIRTITYREDYTSIFSFATNEGDLDVPTPNALLKFTSQGTKILVTLNETNNKNADIAYHLLIAIISPGYIFNITSYPSSSFVDYQGPSVINLFYTYLLLNISSSCNFPSNYTIGSSFDDYCITQDDAFPNPNPTYGFGYQFILRTVTSELRYFDSSPSNFLYVPDEPFNINSNSTILYASVSGLLILILFSLCFILFCIVFLFSRNERFLIIKPKSFSHNFELSLDLKHKEVDAAVDPFPDRRLPPSLFDPSFSNVLLNYPVGTNFEISIPPVDASLPISYIWIKDGEIVEEDQYIRVSLKSHLLIQNVQIFHAGIYVCNIDNSFGHLEIPFILEINEEVRPTELFSNSQESTYPGGNSVLPLTNEVSLDLYMDYINVMHSKNNQGFKKEYIELQECAPNTDNSVSRETDNLSKNRYTNIYPYDHSRVILTPIPNFEQFSHDYINASYIDGASKSSLYIAAQGPLNNTIGDMWRLIWQKEIQIVIMLTNLHESEKVKCSLYWPEDDIPLTFGPFVVKNISIESRVDYIKRIFLLKNLSEFCLDRTVTHYQFLSWPDFGVPEVSSFLHFHQITSTMYTSFSKPTTPPLIHCSAGVGRSGVYIVIDCMLNRIDNKKSINIRNLVNDMRRNRSKMIQTLEQYIFCYDALLVAYLCSKPVHLFTRISLDTFDDYLQLLCDQNDDFSRTFSKLEFQALDCISIKPQDVPCHFARGNLEKNRNPHFLPPDYSTVPLTSTRSYLNAAFIDGFQQKQAYIVAQTPISSTIIEFWKLICDYKISTIVMLSSKDSKEELYNYWPEVGTIQFYDCFQVSVLSVEEDDNAIWRRMLFTTTHENTFEINHFLYHNWLDNMTPADYPEFASFISGVIHSKLNDTDKILVHCSDSVQKSAIFTCSSIVLERARRQNNVDIFQVTKLMRHSRPGSIQTQDQYMATYKTVAALLKIEENFVY